MKRLDRRSKRLEKAISSLSSCIKKYGSPGRLDYAGPEEAILPYVLDQWSEQNAKIQKSNVGVFNTADQIRDLKLCVEYLRPVLFRLQGGILENRRIINFFVNHAWAQRDNHLREAILKLQKKTSSLTQRLKKLEKLEQLRLEDTLRQVSD